MVAQKLKQMVKLWIKVYKHDKIIKQTVVEKDEKFYYSKPTDTKQNKAKAAETKRTTAKETAAELKEKQLPALYNIDQITVHFASSKKTQTQDSTFNNFPNFRTNTTDIKTS